MSSVCSRCSTPNRSGAKFCVGCGAPLVNSARLQPGQVMHGQYVIVRELGRGGMGTVYLATETIANQQRYIVIKEMLDYYDPGDSQAEAKARQRFEAEAATLATLNLTGVPQIFGYFSEGARNYIVMQYIQGRNLETGLTHQDEFGNVVPGQPYPADKVAHWGVQVCKVLEGLAAQNVVHMDIKPANLILDNSDNIWLVDFGTAKAQRVIQPSGQVGMRKSSVYGTDGYAPPEQYQGQAEPRSDVFALAATLYHLLTDDDPRDHPFGFPKLALLSADLAMALQRALEPSLDRRFTAAQFRQSLEARQATGQAFRWIDGSATVAPEGLVELANRFWGEAIRYFTNGDWERWLQTIHRNDLLASLTNVKSVHARTDIALDAFLRTLDPAFPLPRPQTSIKALDFGPVPWQTQRSLDVEIENAGSGCLQGRVVNLPPWLRVSEAEFATHVKQKIMVILDATSLSPTARPYITDLVIEAGTGDRVKIPVIAKVPAPQLAVPQLLDMGTTFGDETLQSNLKVSNLGKSAFEGTASCHADWVTIHPARFRCEPGQSMRLQIEADAESLKPGHYEKHIRIRAAAGKWKDACDVPLVARVSWRRTWRHWAPTLDWAAVGLIMALVLFRGGMLLSSAMTTYSISCCLGIVAVAAIVGGWVSIWVNRVRFDIGDQDWFYQGGFALPWMRDFPAALGGSWGAVMGSVANLWGFAPCILLAGAGGALCSALLHLPGKSTRYAWSGLPGSVTFLLVLAGMIYWAVQPQY